MRCSSKAMRSVHSRSPARTTSCSASRPTLAPGEQLVDQHSDGAYTVLRFRVDCPAPPRVLGISYKLFSDLDPQHRGLLNLQANGANRSAILGPQAPRQQFELKELNRLSQ